MLVNPLDLFSKNPTIANRSIHVDKGLTVHYRHDLPGELDAPQGISHHMLTFFLSPNERQITRLDGHGEYDGPMAPGDFYLCPAGLSGFTRWQSEDKTVHMVMEPEFLSRLALDTDAISPNKIELLPVLKTGDRHLERLVQLFLTEMEHSAPGEKLYLESLSAMIGLHLLRQYCNITPTIRQNSAGLTPFKLNRVLDYIQTDLTQELSLEGMAAHIGMSRCYFATQFKQSTGLSPHQYVSQQRIEKAKQGLRSPTRSITDIALDCGFADQSHLTKVFKKQTGLTPKTYREQY